MDADDSTELKVIAGSDRRPVGVQVHGVPAADLLLQAIDSIPFSQTPWVPPGLEEMAAWLPQYRVDGLLGRGGMGAVYKGEQIALERQVAIKILPKELAADALFSMRFQREAKVLARLQHPGIVTVHDFGQTSAEHPYFVMEFVDGPDLHKLIHNQEIQPERALDIVVQLCDALSFAHEQGIVHRDVKPANVLIADNGRAKLADFGLALPIVRDGTQLTRSSIVMGTPDYMAPEQRQGLADHRSDIYALGVMLYEMLTGERPQGAFDPPSQRGQMDARLDRVVVKALQQQPERRYQTANDFKEDIESIRSPPKRGKYSANFRGRKGLAWISAIVSCGLIVTGSWLWFGRPDAAPAHAKLISPVTVEVKPGPTEPENSAQPLKGSKGGPQGDIKAVKGRPGSSALEVGGVPSAEIRTNSSAKGF